MIEIDGSFGEGGGQIVRTAVALSAVTGKPVRIARIRQGRPKPGLAPQHAWAILALAELCDAKTSGIAPGSSEITFAPGEIRGGSHKVKIGTAGSVTLLMQCLLPALLKTDIPASLEVQGGTDVQWAPTVDYFKNVFLPALGCFGARVSLEVRQRGYYPKGQGSVLLKVDPAKLKAAHLSGMNKRRLCWEYLTAQTCRSTWPEGRLKPHQRSCRISGYEARDCSGGPPPAFHGQRHNPLVRLSKAQAILVSGDSLQRL